jgi:alginate O-acetyltransferase complex protein AlgJ
MLITLFSGCLLAGLLGCIFHWDLYESERENRKLADFPDFRTLAPDQWPTAFETYFNDHFGFRNTFIHRYRKIMRSAGVSDYRVIYGRDNWLFYNEDDIMQDFIGTREYDDALCTAQIRRIEERKQWLAERRIPYLFFIVPNKATIYPDQLPIAMEKLRADRTNRMLFMERLPAELYQTVIDLTPPLQEASKEKLVYLPNDTHWNPDGAYIAYTNMAEHISRLLPESAPALAPAQLIRKETPFIGDLANMTVAPSRYAAEIDLLTFEDKNQWSTNLINDPAFQTIDTKPSDAEPPLSIHNPAGHGTAVILHDSFGLRLQEYLPFNFENTIFIWRYSNRTLLPLVVEYFKPDIVIEEVVERRLIDQKIGALLDGIRTEGGANGL